MDIRDLLENTYYHMKKAEENNGSGNLETASSEYMEAAKCLLEAAQKSEGELKVVRFENAERLMSMSKAIREKSRNQAVQNAEKNRDNDEVAQTFDELGVPVANVPDITFDDVAGLENVKSEIFTKVIYPMRNTELAREYKVSPGGGVLLFGPPGTGKTYIARAISHEVKAKFVYVNPSTLLSKWFGSFEKRIEQLFSIARKNSPVVIFFDEIDALAPKRSRTDSSVMKRAVPQLLAEMDGFSKNREEMVLIIGATNNPWDIDEALMRPGRFDEKIYIAPPGTDARKRLFEISLRGRKTSGEIDFGYLARITDGFSGADIDYICRRVAEQAFRNAIERGTARDIDQGQIEDVIRNTGRTIDRDMLLKFERFKNA